MTPLYGENDRQTCCWLMTGLSLSLFLAILAEGRESVDYKKLDDC